MSYIGREPLGGEVILMNSIESQFNGVLTTFNLTHTVSGVTSAFYPVGSEQLLVSLGGVIQKPDPTGNTGFRISFNTIIFAIAPAAGTSCFIISYGNLTDIGAPANNTVTTDKLVDGSVTPAKLSTGAPTWNTGGTVTVSGDLNVTGSFNSGTQGLFWGDNEPANFGNDNDLKIYHNSANSYIDDDGTGNLYIRSTDLRLQARSTEKNYITANDGGAVEIYNNGLKRLYTSNTGVVVESTSPIIQLKDNDSTGTAALQRIDAVQSSGTTQWFIGQNSTSNNALYLQNVTNDDIIFGTNNTERLKITSTGNLVLNGGNIYGDDDATETLTIQSTIGNNNHSRIDIGASEGSDNGGIHFYTAGSSVATRRITIKGTSGNVGIGTSSPYTTGGSHKLCIASANILSAGPSSSDMFYIRNQGTAGDFAWQTVNSGASAGSIQLQPYGGNVGIGTTNPTDRLHVHNGGIFVRGSASPNLNLTPTDGLSGNGDISFDGTNFTIVSNSSSANLVLGTFSAPRLTINSAGNVGIGTTNPTEKLMVGGGSVRINGGYLKMTGVATPGHEDYIQLQGNGTSYIGVGAEANPTLKFKVGNTSTTVLEVSSTNVRPGADNTYDLGSTARRWANIYSADLQLSNEGSRNDVDGTWGKYTIQEGEEDLFLINRRNGKKYKFVLQEVN